MSPDSDTLCCVLSGEATNTSFIVFGLTWPGLEPTIYHTWGEHANYYTTNVVIYSIEGLIYFKLMGEQGERQLSPEHIFFHKIC
jgi:hypothetical protein